MLKQDGQALLLFPVSNYAEGSLDMIREMMVHPDSLIALGDGGAHYGMICDSSFPTFMMTHWTRQRDHGRVPLEWVIKALSRDNAVAVGLDDRGRIAAGLKADINIIDYDNLRLHTPTAAADLPAGGRRLSQRADGYRATLVSGQVTYRDGQHTGALPGRLIRSRDAA
jgi:N-acyl-D-aspartate/D-glutamate deacylase